MTEEELRVLRKGKQMTEESTAGRKVQRNTARSFFVEAMKAPLPRPTLVSFDVLAYVQYCRLKELWRSFDDSGQR